MASFNYHVGLRKTNTVYITELTTMLKVIGRMRSRRKIIGSCGPVGDIYDLTMVHWMFEHTVSTFFQVARATTLP
jgi:hypothetical protein